MAAADIPLALVVEAEGLEECTAPVKSHSLPRTVAPDRRSSVT